MTRRRLRVISALGIALILFLSGWFFVDVAARRSSFCGNCHYMEPFVAQWKNSTHKGVSCVRCHPTERTAMFAQFVKNATRTYSPRPRAFVPDSACASKDCHSDMPNSKPVKFLTVNFPHQPHLGVDRRGIRLHCASCHGSSLEAGHVSVDPRICYLCHFKGQPVGGTLTWCGSCHGAPTGMSKHGGFVFDMKVYAASGVQCSRCHVAVHEGDGEVSRDKCFACHVNRVEAIGDSKSLHANHVGVREIRCLDCHEPIKHGNIKMLSVLNVSCESCHSNLHAGPKEMYLGVGAKGAPATPSRMFAAQINCTGCHTQVVTQGGMSFLGQGNKTADPKACSACHDSRFIPMVGRWKAEGRTLTVEAHRMANEGKRLSAQSPSNPEVKTLASDLSFNARFLEQGYPVHNIEYAIRTVQASSELLKQLAGSVKANPSVAAIQPAFARNAFSYCNESCHSFIPRKEPYDFQNVDFPHTFHVQTAGLTCDTCHKENQHKELTLAKPSDCASCHHTDAKADCARCHSAQAALYRGKLPAFLGVQAGPAKMTSAVGCADCHDPTQADPLKDVAKSCQNCHDAQGPQNLAAWKKQLNEERDRTTLLVDEVSMVLNGLERRGTTLVAYRTRLETQQSRLAFIEKAKGVHNMAAATAIYEKSRAELTTLLADVTKIAGSQVTGGKRTP